MRKYIYLNKLILIKQNSKIRLDYQYFKKRGIKTPKYNFLTGNLTDLNKNNVTNYHYNSLLS